jgi:20S proteasome alpha/beta subunit
MTICSAGISKEGVIIVSDCRVTYGNLFSDSLVKTYPLTENSSLSFAGNIDCAKFIITHLNGKHLKVSANKGIYSLLKHTAKQIRRLYDKYLQQRASCYVSFLLTGCSSHGCWIGSCESPKFKVTLTNNLFAARTIGDYEDGRKAVNKAMVHAVSSNFSGNNLVMLAGTSVDGAVNLTYIERYKDRAQEHGVSGLLILFKNSDKELEIIEYKSEMFRGRITDRNKALGYAETNSVEFDATINKFRLHNHQTGKSNILSDIYSFNNQKRGIINTNFDPYKLNG